MLIHVLQYCRWECQPKRNVTSCIIAGWDFTQKGKCFKLLYRRMTRIERCSVSACVYAISLQNKFQRNIGNRLYGRSLH